MECKDSFSKYQIIRRLGNGAFGDVYEAIDTSFNSHKSKVAIKIIPKARLNTNTRRRRIAREVTLHSSLPAHPSLLTLHSYFEDSTRVFIITELCPNGNLFRYVMGHPEGLPEDQVRGVIKDIVEGIQGIIDIKSSNVRITFSRDYASGFKVIEYSTRQEHKIADFGLARIIDDSKSDEAFTFCGTPNYISPEILAREPYGLASDIWSLGCILLTLLSGTPPFDGVEIEDVLNRVIDGKYTLPRRISREARALVRQMLEKDPDDRISTMDILKHRFFNGPTRKLSPPVSGLDHSQSIVEEETYTDGHILPTLRTMLKRPGHESASSSVNLYTRPIQHLSQSNRGKRVGLATLLEEIGVSGEYQKRRPSGVSVEEPDHQQVPSRISSSRRASREISERQLSAEDITGNKRHGAYSQGIEREYSSDNMDDGSNPQALRWSYGDSRRASRRKDRSRDRCRGENETRFDPFETDERKYNPIRKYEPLGNPSPGEGLRNALGNIENRLNNKMAKRQSSIHHEQCKSKSQKRSGGKGFATLIEELVLRPEKGIRPSTAFDKLENIDPTSRQQRPEDIQKGLLSLLPSLNPNENRKFSHRRERHISPVVQPSSQESKSFTPLLPSKEAPSKTCSESETFALRYVFSTVGIPPLTQRTKHGLVKITKNGNVELHLPSISRNTFSISSDSKDITISDGRGVVWRGNVDEIPWRWTKVYRYASRFVGICRSRIPRVSVEVDGVKGRIMLNGEFEACDAREGAIIRLNPETRAIKVSSVDEEREDICWQGDINDIPGTWKKLLQSSILLYQKCLAVSSDENADDTAVCVPGIGWCVTQGKRTQLLFEDGVRMEVNLEDKEILYRDINRRKERLRLNQDRLPKYIRERLDRCRAFKDVE